MLNEIEIIADVIGRDEAYQAAVNYTEDENIQEDSFITVYDMDGLVVAEFNFQAK